MKELINDLYEALEEVVEIMQELMQMGQSGMGQRRGRRRSGYREYGGGMGQRNGMRQKEGDDSEKKELLEALEEFMSQKYQ